VDECASDLWTSDMRPAGPSEANVSVRVNQRGLKRNPSTQRRSPRSEMTPHSGNQSQGSQRLVIRVIASSTIPLFIEQRDDSTNLIQFDLIQFINDLTYHTSIEQRDDPVYSKLYSPLTQCSRSDLNHMAIQRALLSRQIYRLNQIH
jgi:hypothetical protein